MTERVHGEEYRREWALEVLKLLVMRKNHLEEALRITKEIGEVLDRNDRVSVQMLLGMRAKELEGIDGAIVKLLQFKEQLPQETQREIDVLLKGEQIEKQLPEMDRIIEMGNVCRKILQEIIAIDKRMSRRVAGADSFYKE